MCVFIALVDLLWKYDSTGR